MSKIQFNRFLWEQFDALIIYLYNSSVSWYQFYPGNNYLTAGPYGFVILIRAPGVVPYISHVNMCSLKGYVFCAVWV